MLLALAGCASTAPFTVQFCPGHPKALTESDRKPHVCHLGDALSLWKAKERRKISEEIHR